MSPKWFVAFLVMLKEAWSTRRGAHIRFLKLQVKMLQARLPGNRVILDPVERRRLMKVGAEVGHAIEHTLAIASVKTYRRWLREEQAGRQPRKVGRPRLTESLRKLIVRLARENGGWGVRRIPGELKKLAVNVSRSSLRRVLVDEKILPDPDRHAPKGVQTPWRKFIAIHMNVMVACDFFCKAVWTPLGKRMAYVLAFVHLGSRQVFLSPSTYNPTEEWMQQQGRNVAMWAAEEGIDVRFLIHDRDTKFAESFDEMFKRADGGVVRTPYGRIMGAASLMLMFDVLKEKKEKLMIGLLQVGIDTRGLMRAGKSWGVGGCIGCGRKWPLIFTGLMLNDPSFYQIPQWTFFDEDIMTYYGKAWNGETALWQMVWHTGITNGLPFQEEPLAQWGKREFFASQYMQTNSMTWPGEALAALLMKARSIWNHDAYFDYCDRWMRGKHEVVPNQKIDGVITDSPLPGHTYDPFIDAMWIAYRSKIPKQPGGKDNLKWVWEVTDLKNGYGRFVPNPKPDPVQSNK